LQSLETQVGLHVAFSFGETYFLSNLINGVYPDYKRVFPSSFDLNATLDLKDFEEAVRFVSPISRDMSYKTINFKFENLINYYKIF